MATTVDVFAEEDLIATARLLKANCKLRNDYCGNCPFKNDKGYSYLCELKGKGEGRLPFEWKIYPR
jgi:hypothetical protein